MSQSRPRITILEPAPDPFGETSERERRIARTRRQARGILALGLLAITIGVAALAAGSGAALGWAAGALIVLGIPTVALADARLGPVGAAGRGGAYAGTDGGFGWGWASGPDGGRGGDCGGGFLGGGDGGGGGGDGGGGGC
jgi:hypothetical protein